MEGGWRSGSVLSVMCLDLDILEASEFNAHRTTSSRASQARAGPAKLCTQAKRPLGEHTRLSLPRLEIR